MSGVDPNRLINLALALAQRHTDETDELAAAHAAYDAETASAWKTEDPEFGNALHLAFMLGDINKTAQTISLLREAAHASKQTGARRPHRYTG